MSNLYTRNEHIDFVKGALVLFMAFNHSLIYFDPLSPLLPYVRFTTGSFVFLTGFISSFIILRRYKLNHQKISSKLILRGGKLLFIFLVLNAIILSSGHSWKLGTDLKLDEKVMYTVFISGTWQIVSFDILIPIAYTMILLGLLFYIFKYKIRFYLILSLGAFTYASIMFFDNREAYIFRYLCLGFTGYSFGCIARDKIEFIIERKWIFIYLFLFCFILINKVPLYYPLYALIIIVNLIILYIISNNLNINNLFRKTVCTIGEMSLLAYLLQILLLRICVTIFKSLNIDEFQVEVSFLIVVFLTFVTIVAVEKMRSTSDNFARAYRYILM